MWAGTSIWPIKFFSPIYHSVSASCLPARQWPCWCKSLKSHSSSTTHSLAVLPCTALCPLASFSDQSTIPALGSAWFPQPSLPKPSLLLGWCAGLELCSLTRVPSSWDMYWPGSLPKPNPPAYRASMPTHGSLFLSPTPSVTKHMGKFPASLCWMQAPRSPWVPTSATPPAALSCTLSCHMNIF